MEWDLVIGLEVHAQLKTNSKLFSGASTQYGAKANSQTCFIDAGLPGVLPVLNQQAVTMAIKLGLALNADINDQSTFERKNYFYPDLPKGYQISQFQKPIVSNGVLPIILADGSKKIIFINRAHLEEDAGKSIHDLHARHTAIDLNRAGTPLLEIVTTPCLHTAEEAITYLKTLHQLVRFLGICDGNMQEGSFRCDVNLSLKEKGSSTLGTRTELKNLNSFRYIEKAIMLERSRQQEILEQGGSITQETRLYNPDNNSTSALRDKENENDYRYFPDPDLLPIQITRCQIAEVKHHLPPLPQTIREQLAQDPTLLEEEIQFILSSPEIYAYYLKVKQQEQCTAKTIINWLRGPFSTALNTHSLSIEHSPISAQDLAQLLARLENNSISFHLAKTVFNTLWSGGKNEGVLAIIKQAEEAQDQNDTAIEALVISLISEYPDQAEQYKAGKEKLFAFFMGQIMKKLKGRADPEQLSAILHKYLR